MSYFYPNLTCTMVDGNGDGNGNNVAMTISITDGNKSSDAGKRIQLRWMEEAGIKS